MTQKDKDELAKYREFKKKQSIYRQKYEKENYKRMVCVYPKKYEEEINKAMELSGATSVSNYLSILIERDLKEKGLLTDQPD